jgi:gamma-glutamylcyclotransferase (GGCT)/AIG2-like uncharacterized protein YtfP
MALKGQKFLGPDKIGPNLTLYHLGGFPAILDSGEDYVVGEVYEVDEETLATIDAIEGFYPGNKKGSLYYRTTVRTEEHGDVFTYFLWDHNLPSYAIKVDSGDWVDFIEKEKDVKRGSYST